MKCEYPSTPEDLAEDCRWPPLEPHDVAVDQAAPPGRRWDRVNNDQAVDHTSLIQVKEGVNCKISDQGIYTKRELQSH